MLGAPLRALIITGDTASAMKELPATAHMRIASKPIDSEELLSLLRTVLAAP